MLSIIICTYNRAVLLDHTLESIFNQQGNAHFEVIVVDNNSIDFTPKVIQKWQAEGKFLFVSVKETHQGLSHARNTGIKQAQGDLIAFIDDDVILYKDWIFQVVYTFSTHSNVDCVTGPSEPDWEIVPPPSWLSRELIMLLAPGDYGPTPKLLTGKEYPPGGNMALRRKMIDRIGWFNPDLGYKGESLLGGEEVDYIDRLWKLGGKVLYNPAMRVKHFISITKMSRGYLRKKRYDQGIAIAIWENLHKGKFGLLRNAILRILLIIPRDWLLWSIAKFKNDDSQQFNAVCRLIKTIGYLSQSWKIFRNQF